MNTPEVIQKKKFSGIWILPIIALIIGAGLIYKSYNEKGYMISLQISDATGIKLDKTEVLFKGIPVGIVRKMRVTSDLKNVKLIIEMVKEAEDELVEDTQFWIVRPKLSLTKISGLETIISGSYIGVIPGKSTKRTKVFIASDDIVDADTFNTGKAYTLTAKSTGGHKKGEPIIYKKLKVGEVVSSELLENDTIQFKIVIYNEYAYLINSSTLFWDASGFEMDANLSNINLRMGSLESLLIGGIEFATPRKSKSVEPEHKFHLYKNRKNAFHSKDKLITLDILVENTVTVGTKIKFSGVDIGQITDLDLSKSMDKFQAKARVTEKAKALLTTGSYLWVVKPEISLSGVRNLDTAIKGAYIDFIKGKGKSINHFQVHSSPPLTHLGDSGLDLVLVSDTLNSIKRGHPVLYRQFKVGEVLGAELSLTKQSILIHILIHEPYKNLVTEGTKFWNSSGVNISGGLLSKMKIQTESLQTILAGGISFATPDNSSTAAAESGHNFPLHREVQEKWLSWSPYFEVEFENEKKGQPQKKKTK